MPLHPLHDAIVRVAAGLPESRTIALAGGGAMIAHGFVDRETQDVDLFTEIDDAEAQQVTAALRAALHDQGLSSRDADRPPLDHRFIAINPADGAECIVEVFADGGRLRQRVMLDVGPVLHPDDLAADKVLALWGRARPRDFYDVHALMQRYERRPPATRGRQGRRIRNSIVPRCPERLQAAHRRRLGRGRRPRRLRTRAARSLHRLARPSHVGTRSGR